ncbi:MAG: type VI secretion system tube protein Hcp [Planctomycetota bacterium]
MILLKFKKEIKGDATVKGHEGWITLDSIKMGCGRSVSCRSGGTDRETSTPKFQEVTCSKSCDIASTELFMQSICGVSLEEAELDFMQTDGKDSDQVYLTIKLEDPIVTNFTSASSGGRPGETFNLNFTKIKMEYTQFSGESKKKASPKGWDLMKGTAW